MSAILRECFAVRPVTEADKEGGGRLKRVLTAWSLTAIGLGATIGTGGLAAAIRSRVSCRVMHPRLLIAVVCVALLSNGLFEIIFSYREHTEALVRIQREQAEGAAEKISHFVKEIENQMGWTTQLTWSASTIEARKFDGSRLLRQVPAITEFAQLDASGKQRLRVSRLAMDLGGDEHDYSRE